MQNHLEFVNSADSDSLIKCVNYSWSVRWQLSYNHLNYYLQILMLQLCRIQRGCSVWKSCDQLQWEEQLFQYFLFLGWSSALKIFEHTFWNISARHIASQLPDVLVKQFSKLMVCFEMGWDCYTSGWYMVYYFERSFSLNFWLGFVNILVIGSVNQFI